MLRSCLALTALSVVACGGMPPECREDGECPGGPCVDGVCTIAGVDAGRPDLGPGPPDGGGADPDAGPRPDVGVFDPDADSDGDTVRDGDEGRTASFATDTDGDGAPDFLDTDSDDDGLDDAQEAGDSDLGTPPVDSDGDGRPDLRDLDSDGNGVPDAVEGGSDADGDGRIASVDPDNDGDGLDDVVEIGADPAAPRDTDGDGTFDLDSPDSDGDAIGDAVEVDLDTDGDGTLDRYDLDSDGDGVPDRVEAGDGDLATPPVDTDGDGAPDYRDRDSDGDFLGDAQEVAEGTSRTAADTDLDGASDLAEVASGSDPTLTSDNPAARGELVFVMPFGQSAVPASATADASAVLQRADVFLLVDTTESMGEEIAALQLAFTATIARDIEADLPEAWFGVGAFDDYPLFGPTEAYGDPNCGTDTDGVAHDVPFAQGQRMTSTVSAAQAAVDRLAARCGGDDADAGLAALHALAARSTLGGFARFEGNTRSPPTCPAGGAGSACFRADAVPIVVVITDHDHHNSRTCLEPPYVQCEYGLAVPGNGPTYGEVREALDTLEARVVGVYTQRDTRAERFLGRLVIDTVLARGGTEPGPRYRPLALNGAGLAGAIVDTVALAAAVPMDVSARVVDRALPGETLDARVFVASVEARTTAAPDLDCATGLATFDREGIDADDVAETFRDAGPDAPVCYDVRPADNVSVTEGDELQVFRAGLEIVGDRLTPVDEVELVFVVPADLR